MTQIIPANQFNPAALAASGFYISIQNPPSYIRGVPTDVIGMVGTAGWGPVNKPVHMGSGQDGIQAFGPITPAALTDIHDLPTDITLAFLQSASQASLEGWAVRVTDGTDTAASVALAGAASAAGETATVGGTITATDVVTLTATSSAITGSPVHVVHAVLVGDTTSTIAAALAAGVNANAALAAAGVFASVAGAVVTLDAPSALSPAVVWSESVTGGSTTETVTLATTTAATAGATVVALYTGSGGNSAGSPPVGGVQLTIVAAPLTGRFNVSVVPPFGGNSELFLNLPGGSAFWAALKSALNNGQSPSRGPSHIVSIPGAPNIAVGVPTPGTFGFSGGTDGRTGVTTSTLVGSDTAQPRTGLYALRSLNPGVGIVWLVGCTDTTAPTTLVNFGQSESCSVLWAFPSGTDTPTALAGVATIGASDPSLNYLKDWVYWQDTANAQQRLSPPYAFHGGMWATYAPQNSPDNKPVNGVLGTERNNPQTGNSPYTISEIGQLQSAGISIITNPINAGTIWGTWGGRSTSQDPATQPSEYWRMTTYLARSLAGFGGKYVGQLQSQQPNDPVRRQIKLELNNFFNLLAGLGQIDDITPGGATAATVLCEFSSAPGVRPGLGMNTPASIAQHFLYAMCVVRYLSSIWFFILTLQGGTTVQVQIVQSQPTVGS